MTSGQLERTRGDAVAQLETEFTALLGHFRRRIAATAARVSDGLLPGSFKVFSTIARNEAITPSSLAEMLLIDKGQLSRCLRDLEQRELIERHADPQDGRSTLLYPTESGRERLAAARVPHESLTAVLQDWPVTDIDTLARLLHALVNGERP